MKDIAPLVDKIDTGLAVLTVTDDATGRSQTAYAVTFDLEFKTPGPKPKRGKVQKLSITPGLARLFAARLLEEASKAEQAQAAEMNVTRKH